MLAVTLPAVELSGVVPSEKLTLPKGVGDAELNSIEYNYVLEPSLSAS